MALLITLERLADDEEESETDDLEVVVVVRRWRAAMPLAEVSGRGDRVRVSILSRII